MIQNIESILDNPVVLLIITLAIIVGVYYQRQMSYQEAMALHELKKKVFPVLNPWLKNRGRPLIRTKGRFDDPEVVMTLNKPAYEVAQELREYGFIPNLISTLKRIPANGDSWLYSHSQWVYYHEDGSQTEVMLFQQNGITSVYVHVETSITDPEGHLNNKQIAGDDKGVVAMALGKDNTQ